MGDATKCIRLINLMQYRFIIALFYLFFTGIYSSISQVYNVTRYSTDAGLHQSQVMALIQDSKGYLWLGTHRGASKFDGKNFTNYEPGKNGLAGNFLADLLEDEQGNIWMATDKGLNRFDGQNFTQYSNRDGLTDENIQTLAMDHMNRIWIGSKSGTIFLWDQQKIIPVPYPWSEKDEEVSILSMLEDHHQNVWIGTSKGLYTVNLNDPQPSIKPFSRSEAKERREIHCILEFDHKIWLGTNHGIQWIDNHAQKIISADITNLPDKTINCMVGTPKGEVWIGTGMGIVRYKDEKFTQIRPNDRLLRFQIRSATLDKEGNIWFGTDGGGLRKITEGVFESIGMDEGLSSNIAKSFLQDQEGNIWISSKDRGINIYHGKTNLIVEHLDMQDGLGGNAICTSFEDSRKNFWFASYNGTLTRFDGNNFFVYGEEHGLQCNAVYYVSEDAEKNIWAGTDNGMFLKLGNRFVRTHHEENGLSSNIVYSMATDHLGRLWVGTAAGLDILSDEGITHLHAPDEVGTNVITLLEDRDKRMWVGSSKGLAFVQDDKAQWVRISGAPGAHTVVALVLENDRYLWVGTENGAYRLNLGNYTPFADERPRFELYTQKDGLPSLECNANAAFEDREGNIWLGTAEGAIFRPRATVRKEDQYKPQIYITKVQSSSQDTSWEALDYQLDDMGLPRDLTLSPDDNRLDFSFIGISLKSPKQVEYRFMLEGVDDDWLRPTRQTSVFYPNLSPGSYTFKVVAKMEAAPWDYSDPATFSFTINPPFTQTWYFYLLMALLLIGLGLGIYQQITARRRRQAEEQHIRDTAEKLQLEHQALYAMMNPHFTFNALQSIQYFIHRQDKKSANKFLSSFAKLVRKNLESTKSDFITLAEEVERLKLYLSLEKMRFPEKFDFIVSTGYDVESHDIQIPPMILQPFVENSIKHGIMPLDSDGEITINIEKMDEDYLRIIISDNGIGIEASKKRKANRPSDHVSKGMQITLDRLALFARMTHKKYSLDIKEKVNSEGKVTGTQVEMILPIKQEGF